MVSGSGAGPERAVRQVREPGDLLERVHHDVAHASRDRAGELVERLVVTVHRDLFGRYPGGQRHLELAAGTDVDAEAFRAHPAQHRPGAERLRGVEHPPIGAERLQVLAAPRPDVFLVADVQRRAELGGQIPHVHAAERQHAAGSPGAARPDPGVQRVQIGRRGRRMVGGQHVTMAWPGRVRDTAHQDCGDQTPAFRPGRKRRSTSLRMSVRCSTFRLSARAGRAPTPPGTAAVPGKAVPGARGGGRGDASRGWNPRPSGRRRMSRGSLRSAWPTGGRARRSRVARGWRRARSAPRPPATVSRC